MTSPTAPPQPDPYWLAGRRENRVRLSRDQQRTWLVDQLSTLPGGYLTPVFLHLAGPLDRRALIEAVRAVAERHEVLRTSVGQDADGLVGILRPASDVSVSCDDLDADDLQAFLERESQTPLDVAAGPPMRVRLMRLGPEEHVLAITAHHLAFDDWSQGILHRELAAAYAALREQRPIYLPELPGQYRDVALAIEQAEDPQQSEADLEYWRETLADAEPFELPTDRPRPAQRDGRGASERKFALSQQTTAQLAEIGRDHGATMVMVLMAATQTVLHQGTGTTDVTVGTTFGLRHSAEAEDVIGLFVNMLPIRTDLSGDPTFAALLERVRDTALDAYDHATLPFDRMVEELAPERDLARTPLFQVLVNFGARRREPLHFPGLTVTELTARGHSAKYDLGVGFVLEDDELHCELGWDTALYEDATVERLAGRLRTALEHIAVHPGAPISTIPLMTAAQEAELRALAMVEATPFPDRCLHELFERQAAARPTAVAVIDEDSSLTYSELNARAEAIAARLRAAGAGPNVAVGVLLERSPDLVAALLGILKAGSAYLPIEPGTPAARTVGLLRDAGAPVCLVGSAEDEVAVGAVCTPLTVQACYIGSPLAGDGAPVAKADPLDLCSIYYTSGSTGKPKGVASTHAGWVNRMWWMQQRHNLAPGEVVLHKTTLTFDDSAVEVFWPLAVGGTVAVLPPGAHRDPWAIIEAAVRFQAVHVNFVPSILDLVLEALTDDDIKGLSKLRSVLSSGEALRAGLVARFREVFGDRVSLDNTWGATEVSIDSTFHICAAADAVGDGVVSLGRPMANNEVVVLDSALRPVPVGVVGELCIAGVGLARGYLGDAPKTAGAFVPHPWRPGERVYRTGDRGRMLADGTLEFRGRVDEQVKIRGVRIELGEVDAALRNAPGVTDAAALVCQGPNGDKYLAAYVVFGLGVEPSVDGVHAAVRERLTGYAVPSVIIAVTAIPRFASGKLDRRTLPAPTLGGTAQQARAAAVPPDGPAEEAVAAVFTEVLGVTGVGAHDNFFGLGGHSLLAVRAVNRLRETVGLELNVGLLFQDPTVAGLAARVEELLVAELETLSDAEVSRRLEDS